MVGLLNENASRLRVSLPLLSVPRRRSPVLTAARDLWTGLREWWVWGTVAWFDIKHRYRGSMLGPFWITISNAIMIVSLGFLYSKLFKQAIADYLPYLAMGQLMWSFMSTLMSDCCNAFIQAESVLKQISMPLSIQLYRAIWRNLIIFAHNIVVIVAVAFWFQLPLGWIDLLALPGFVLVVLCMSAVGLLLALLCARFRDVGQIVNSGLQIIFFLTPIMWKKELLAADNLLLLLNPFNDLIEIVRAPLLGGWPAAGSWLMAMGCTAFSWALAFLLFVRCRPRVVYWV